ncbi:MAG: hypothetical protein VKL39_08850 [Leptolyngbyaceae bacterium]|nr:hypothetical protein [Leptolyngbyaceae bacterium]
MHSAIIALRQRTYQIGNSLRVSAAVTSLLLAMLASAASSNVVQGAEGPIISQLSSGSDVAIATSPSAPQLRGSNPPDATGAQLAQTITPLEDGVYLYGQSPVPEQLGSAYLVFEVSSSDVVGAFYMPHSSFDCFNGEFQSNQLALQITDSYEQVTFPYSIALERDTEVASSGDLVSDDIGLAGFHPIESVSENDYRILNVCKTDQLESLQD